MDPSASKCIKIDLIKRGLDMFNLNVHVGKNVGKKCNVYLYHSMARTNLNKYFHSIKKSASTEIPPFRPKFIFLKYLSLNKCEHCEVRFTL